jgi:hypothetical protein
MNKGELTIVEGDATAPQVRYPEEISVIPHVCNDGGGWGAGFVLALSSKWKAPETTYRNFCRRNAAFPLLGTTSFVKVDPYIVIANMIAQSGYINENTNPIPLKYKALVNCMADVAARIEMIRCQVNNNVVIHCPKFGSDLAGGKWEFILELIREIWLEAGIDVVVYEWVE